MKRVLVIAYYFPPRPSIASLRLGGLAKYLPRFGWETVVVTPAYPGRSGWSVPIVETADRDVLAELKRRLGLKGDKSLRGQLGVSPAKKQVISSMLTRLSTFARTVWCYPDEQRGWFGYALEAALYAARGFGCSVILSSSGPVTAHLVGKAVKVKTGLPWLADLRDLWTDNHYYPFPGLRRVVERQLEQRTLSGSNALVTVSEPLAEKLSQRFEGIPVYSITNGYDPDDVAPPCRLAEKFTITYTGTIYGGKQDPSALFAALAKLVSQYNVDRHRIQVRFYGPDVDLVEPLGRMFGVEDMVVANPPVARDDALRLQRESHVLLLLNWNDPSETGIYTGKVFEYLAAQRPILAVGGPGGVVAELLKETGVGVHASDPDAIYQTLAAWWENYSLSGVVPYGGDLSRVERYSQINMARAFATVLGSIAG